MVDSNELCIPKWIAERMVIVFYTKTRYIFDIVNMLITIVLSFYIEYMYLIIILYPININNLYTSINNTKSKEDKAGKNLSSLLNSILLKSYQDNYKHTKILRNRKKTATLLNTNKTL